MSYSIELSNLEDIQSFRTDNIKRKHEALTYKYKNASSEVTVIIAASCNDGVVIIGDRKVTFQTSDPKYEDKLRGDLAHVIIGYAGSQGVFDIFRRYVIGDAILSEQENPDNYRRNLIPTIADKLRLFNTQFTKINSDYEFHIVVGRHFPDRKTAELYKITPESQSYDPLPYCSLGLGQHVADMFCKDLRHSEITMKEFTKHAYLAIRFMEKYLPHLKVGTDPNDPDNAEPMIRHLPFDGQWDKEPKNEMQYFKDFTKERLEAFDQILR